MIVRDPSSNQSEINYAPHLDPLLGSVNHLDLRGWWQRNCYVGDWHDCLNHRWQLSGECDSDVQQSSGTHPPGNCGDSGSGDSHLAVVGFGFLLRCFGGSYPGSFPRCPGYHDGWLIDPSTCCSER